MVEYYKNSEGGQLQDKRVLVNSWARPPRRRGLTHRIMESFHSPL